MLLLLANISDPPTTTTTTERNAHSFDADARYGNIMAYDRTRVVLDMMNGDPDTTYINGNWVDGYKQTRAYIAAQGPVPNSFISHWRMIWQYVVPQHSTPHHTLRHPPHHTTPHYNAYHYAVHANELREHHTVPC